jgi:hypothetical protein
MDLSLEEQERLMDLDNEAHQLIVGWAYLRSNLRRALSSGDSSRLSAMATPEVLACVSRASRQTIPSESPQLQLLGVDWLDGEHVIYRVREACPSALAGVLIGPGLLEATVSCGRGGDWRLRALEAVEAVDPDQLLHDGLYAKAWVSA